MANVSTMQPFAKGDIFAGATLLNVKEDDHAGDGRIIQYDSSLNEKGVLWTEGTTHLIGGLSFAPDGTLWAFDSNSFTVIRVSPAGKQLPKIRFADRAFSNITFAKDGTIYLGEHLVGNTVRMRPGTTLGTTLPKLPGSDRFGDGRLYHFTQDGKLLKEYATPVHGGMPGFLSKVSLLPADKFGFVTTLKLSSGEERDLFLEDATSVDIKKVLSELRKSLTAEDQLLVFYAGHGQIDAEKKAYWVPVDGKSGDDWTWIEAHDITEGLRKLASGAVLLISDSCYAGGLSRSGSPEAEEGSRDRYLAKATRYKARQLIASGGDEPVQDGGGGGHSLFARALLEALEEMPEKIFTANELFDAKVKPKAIEYAFAASAEGQTPVFYRMTQAGDEPESEFIFVAK